MHVLCINGTSVIVIIFDVIGFGDRAKVKIFCEDMIIIFLRIKRKVKRGILDFFSVRIKNFDSLVIIVSSLGH